MEWDIALQPSLSIYMMETSQMNKGQRYWTVCAKNVKLQEWFWLWKTTYRLVGHIKGTSWNFSEKKWVYRRWLENKWKTIQEAMKTNQVPWWWRSEQKQRQVSIKKKVVQEPLVWKIHMACQFPGTQAEGTRMVLIAVLSFIIFQILRLLMTEVGAGIGFR